MWRPKPGCQSPVSGFHPSLTIPFSLAKARSRVETGEALEKTKARKPKDPQLEKMPVMEKLRMFVAQEPIVAASCLIAGVGLFLPAVVRPILDSFETSKPVPPPALNDVVAGVTGKKQS